MRAFKQKTVRGCFGLTLLTCMCIASAATNNECAILATQAGGDLAVDDPARYEQLTQACGQWRPAAPKAPRTAPVAPVAHQPGKPAQKTGVPPKHSALQRVGDSPAKGDEKEGCAYRFYPVKNLKHPIGTEACINGRTEVCKKNAKGVVVWDLIDGSQCSGANVIDIKTRELNTRESILTNDAFKLFQE
ncbi:MAG: hypothetical protein WAQ08_00670 [Aquabacterium sp.]|uniref:hypothetical protein n=1 Tax=Aquabacterium sp. TaxID=1872578 RepID=UPI003BB0DC80